MTKRVIQEIEWKKCTSSTHATHSVYLGDYYTSLKNQALKRYGHRIRKGGLIRFPDGGWFRKYDVFRIVNIDRIDKDITFIKIRKVALGPIYSFGMHRHAEIVADVYPSWYNEHVVDVMFVRDQLEEHDLILKPGDKFRIVRHNPAWIKPHTIFRIEELDLRKAPGRQIIAATCRTPPYNWKDNWYASLDKKGKNDE